MIKPILGDISIEIIGYLPLRERFTLWKLSVPKRKKLLRKVADRIIRDSKKRVRQQVDLQGNPFKRRWKKRKDRRKMLSKLIKQARVLTNDGEKAKIGFPGKSGNIAAKQQFGFETDVSIDQFRRKTLSDKIRSRENSARYGSQAFRLATRRQAAVLRSLGYKKQGEKRPATMAWIQTNITIARAGAIIRSMRKKQGIRRDATWHTILPARSFLGASDKEIGTYITEIFQKAFTSKDKFLWL